MVDKLKILKSVDDFVNKRQSVYQRVRPRGTSADDNLYPGSSVLCQISKYELFYHYQDHCYNKQ